MSLKRSLFNNVTVTGSAENVKALIKWGFN